MPPTADVLAGLTAIANEWRQLAVAWHVCAAALLAGLVARWRPSTRALNLLLVLPLLSVSVVAWLSGNPFNGSVFAIVAATLVGSALRASRAPVHFASPPWVAAGIALIAYGLAYPHFLRTDSWIAFLYAAPFGLVPCPTLSAVIGTMLLFRNGGSTVWNATLVVAGLLYGGIGVFRLGVALDWGLLLGSAALAAAVLRGRAPWRSVRADRYERTPALTGVESQSEAAVAERRRVNLLRADVAPGARPGQGGGEELSRDLDRTRFTEVIRRRPD